MPAETEEIVRLLKDFVEKSSNIMDLQFDPRLPPKLLLNPWAEDYESKKRTAHYFLLVASIDERGVVWRAENARCLIVELHKRFKDELFEIIEPEKFRREIIEYKRFNELGPLRTKIWDILSSVNRFVIEKAKGDLIKLSEGFKQPKEMVKELGKYIKRMDGPLQKKAWIYMRWMVRPQPDLRIFTNFSPRNLFIPTTSQIARVAVCLGLIEKVKPLSWRHVEKVTNFARKLYPEDPAKADYPLFLIGRWLEGKDLTQQNLKETLIKFEHFYRKTGFSILLIKEKIGYSAECPCLPGCITQGETEDDVLRNMEEAINSYLETAHKFRIEGVY